MAAARHRVARARAESPTGGIGATINVKTARPLDLRERVTAAEFYDFVA